MAGIRLSVPIIFVCKGQTSNTYIMHVRKIVGGVSNSVVCKIHKHLGGFDRLAAGGTRAYANTYNNNNNNPKRIGITDGHVYTHYDAANDEVVVCSLFSMPF